MSSRAVPQRSVKACQLGLENPLVQAVSRAVPVEAPVAIEYNGFGYAVMMATPSDLKAYAVGFSLAEGLVESAAEIESVLVHAANGGWIVRVNLPWTRMTPIIDRARTRVSESGCGLCGMDSIEAVLAPLPPVTARIRTSREALARALSELRNFQPLSRATGAAHAAAFCTPDGAIQKVYEDVGRHNALDKLIGALALESVDPAGGFVLLSARCSYELVEKSVRAGFPMLVTISAPTSLAVERARDAGLVLISLARSDSVLLLHDPAGTIA